MRMQLPYMLQVHGCLRQTVRRVGIHAVTTSMLEFGLSS